MTRYLLPIEVEALDDGNYLAVCPIIQGCHAEGATISEAIENVQDVAQQMLELRVEDGLPLPDGLRVAEEETLVRGEVLVTVGH
jgi:predicted RNase H-like HicB family nuclease